MAKVNLGPFYILHIGIASFRMRQDEHKKGVCFSTDHSICLSTIHQVLKTQSTAL